MFALILFFPQLVIWSNESLLDFRFDAIVSADAFENLKPAPDIFLAASKNLGVDTNEVIYLAN
jgi:beta-phosphoglucomutase-like phosphatase (HAD superfamily)